MSRLKHDAGLPHVTIVTGTCPHDCPDTCAWQVAVDRRTGRAVDIWGHPEHPITRGRLCGKVDRYLERVYHPDRLTVPLKRVGPKGSGQFVPVTWEHAVAEIAARLADIIGTHGPEAVLPYSYAGTMGLLQGEGMAQRFFNRMGASRLARTICSAAGFQGYKYTLGAAVGMEMESFARARLILLWGTNTLTSNLHLWPFIQEARRQGARVIAIDPVRTRTARAADEWVPVRPGTDGALALAMMHVIVEEGLYDAEYVERFTVGFEQLRERVRAWPPERAEAITGVSAGRIRRLAREYATVQPAAIRINYGLQRHAGGGMAVRTIACLPALVGAWRHEGGGLQLSTSGAFAFDFRPLYRPDLLGGRLPRTLNMIRLGDALSLDPARLARAHYCPRPVDSPPPPDEAGPPVKALIVYNSNPAAVAPDQRAVIEGLSRDDLFTVVLEHFQTDTADYADYVLPATTQLEHWDLVKPYGHYYLGLNRPAIAPLGEALPNSEIFRRLAAALGFDDPCFQEDDVTILRTFVEAQTHPVFRTVTWEKLLEQGFVRLDLPTPYLPFAEGRFPTPSDKCEFYSESMARDGYDPLPTWTPPAGAAGSGGTLWCISSPAHSFLNTTFVNVERLRRREGEPTIHIHPEDARARGIVHGQRVRVWNEQGDVILRAVVTEEIAPGVVWAPSIWWNKLSPEGRNINQVTSQKEADMGGGARFYDVRVWVEPASASPVAEGERAAAL